MDNLDLLDPLDKPIFGLKAIAEAIGESERRTQYLAAKGYIPVSHAGRLTYSTLRRLLRFVNGQ